MVSCLVFIFFFILKVGHLFWNIWEIKTLKFTTKISQHSDNSHYFLMYILSVCCLSVLKKTLCVFFSDDFEMK